MAERAVPEYQRVADLLRDAILSGELPDESKLPSIVDLAEEHGITRGVAERVMAQLRGEGLVIGRKGAGFMVKKFERIPRESPGRLLRSHWGSGKAIQDHDTAGRRREMTPDIGEGSAPDYVAKAFDLPAGTTVAFRKRLFTVDDRPVQQATSYFEVDVVRGTQIMHTDTGPGGTYARLDELGYGPTHFREVVIARAASLDEAKVFKLMKRAAIVFDIVRYAWSGKRCVEVNHMVLDAAAYELANDFSAS